MDIKKKNNIRVILCFLLLTLVCSIIFVIFKIEISNEISKENNVGFVANDKILPTPDRIIYKNQNDEYIRSEERRVGKECGS